MGESLRTGAQRWFGGGGFCGTGVDEPGVGPEGVEPIGMIGTNTPGVPGDRGAAGAGVCGAWAGCCGCCCGVALAGSARIIVGTTGGISSPGEPGVGICVWAIGEGGVYATAWEAALVATI
jgi:hypothetical protein